MVVGGAREQQLALLEEQLEIVLRRSRRFRREAAVRVHPEIDGAVLTALIVLVQLAPVRLGELAEELGVDKSTMSRHVGALIRLGLATRCPDPLDRRAHLLSPSTDGRRRIRAVADARREMWQDRLAGWTGDELADLVTVLSRFTDDLRPAPAEPAPVALADPC